MHALYLDILIGSHINFFFFQDDDERAESALDGLKQVMTVKSRVVLPYLVPQVNKNPPPPQKKGVEVE